MNEALSRIKRYVQMLHDKPLSQMGDVVHGVHTGTEWEAELRISDLREVLNLIEELKDALQWMVENDETNEGDEPLEGRSGQSWNEINAYWIDGLNKARNALKEVSDE